MPLSITMKIFLLLFAISVQLSASKILTLERAFPVSSKNSSFVELERLRAYDKARHARMLQRVVNGGVVVDFDVSGSSDPYLIGLYFTKVKLGTPPREFNVQIDTGSDVLWVNCNSCNGCPQSSGLGIQLSFYDSSISSTSALVSCSDRMCSSIQTNAAECSMESNQCTYSFKYGDGSGTSGYYVNDLMYFDTVMANSYIANSSASIVFGCSNYQSGDLTKADKAIDGIFGFGQQQLSIISQLSSRGITSKVFSHCLKGEGSGGGILVIGEVLEPGIIYSPLVQSQPHYNLMMQSISVNRQLLPIDPSVFATAVDRGTIVDSGTTLTYLVAEAYDPFVDAISASVSQYATPVVSRGHQCYVVSTSIADIFPTVSLNFASGASMDLRAEEYLVQMGFADGAPMWCIGFQKAQNQDLTILGDLVLKDKIIVYDLARQRIGWVNYDCSSSVHVSVTSSMDEFVNAGQLSVNSSPCNKVFDLVIMSILALLSHVLACNWSRQP